MVIRCQTEGGIDTAEAESFSPLIPRIDMVVGTAVSLHLGAAKGGDPPGCRALVASSHVDATGLASPSGMPFTSRRVRVSPQSHPPHPPTVPSRGPVYRRRRPTQTLLYPLVQHHLETFLAQATEVDPMGVGVPSWVERDFRAYLRCGILAHGFARARCAGCGYDFLVAFSCRSRGACPSCATPARRTSSRWAALIARIYDVLPLVCPSCGASMSIIAFVTDPVPVRSILSHLHLPTQPPPLSGPRPTPDRLGLRSVLRVRSHGCGADPPD